MTSLCLVLLFKPTKACTDRTVLVRLSRIPGSHSSVLRRLATCWPHGGTLFWNGCEGATPRLALAVSVELLVFKCQSSCSMLLCNAAPAYSRTPWHPGTVFREWMFILTACEPHSCTSGSDLYKRLRVSARACGALQTCRTSLQQQIGEQLLRKEQLRTALICAVCFSSARWSLR